MPKVPRDEENLFVSDYSQFALLDAVREVAQHASPLAPALCSGPQFNEARAAAGHPDAPTAVSIARRLRCSWPALLSALFDPDCDEHRFVAMRGRDTHATGLTLDDAVAAVRFSAWRLGSPPELSRAQHDDVMRSAREAANRRRSPEPHLVWLYPTADAIDKVVGWQPTLLNAGLDAGTGRNPGMPLVDAMELFLHEHGYLAGGDTVLDWVRGLGFSVADRRATDALRELRERRAKQGRWTPPAYASGKLRAKIAAAAAPTPPSVRPDGPRKRRTWEPEAIRDGLLIAADTAQRKRHALDQRFIKRLAREDPRVPTWSVIDRAARPEPDRRRLAQRGRPRARPSRPRAEEPR